jgi:integrase
LARRRYQKGSVWFSEHRQIWLGRYREDIIRADGTTVRKRPQVELGTKKELPTKRLAIRKLDEILFPINAPLYQPTRISTIREFAKRYREEVLSKRKPSTIRAANSHFDAHILLELGQLRLDQIGPENQQIFINSLQGASRKTVLNVLSTLSKMLTTAKNWGYAAREIELAKLVLPERNSYVARHFTLPQVESILELAQEPWRTFFILLALTGLRAGEALGLQWADIDFQHKHSPLGLVWENPIHKEQGQRGARNDARQTRFRSEWLSKGMEIQCARVSFRHSEWLAAFFQQSRGVPTLADSRCARNPTLRTPCIPSLGRVFYRRRGLFTRGRTKTTPPYQLAHHTRIHSSARGNHRKGHGGRRGFYQVGRSWTRYREGKSVYSVSWSEMDVGSIPIARSNESNNLTNA